MSKDNSISSRSIDWLSILVFSIVFLWVVSITLFIQPFAWLIHQLVLTTGYEWPSSIWLLITATQSLLLLSPTLILGWLWQNHRYQVIYQIWAASAGCILLYAPIRLVPPAAPHIVTLLQILITVVILIVVLIVIWKSSQAMPRIDFPWALAVGLFAAGVMIYPWLAWGALGSLLDTTLNLFAGLLFGGLVGLILSYLLFQPLHDTGHNDAANIVIGGLAAGATLLILSSGFGYSGIQLLLMIVLPASGWLLTMLFEWFNPHKPASSKWIASCILVGILAATPMMFVDGDELSLELALGAREQLTWALYAALTSMVIGLLLSLLLAAFHKTMSARRLRPMYIPINLGVWIIGAFIYFAVGQPGFYGDQLFVIFSEQADLSPASSLQDYKERRSYIYETLTKHAESSQHAISLILNRFGIDHTSYYLVNAMAVDGGPLIRLWLESRSEVDRVLENPILRPLPAQAKISYGKAKLPDEVPWNLSLIGADKVWRELGVTGKGIVVGHSDSGVDGTHSKLALSYRGRGGDDDYNWFDPWYHTQSPTDISGHGTHTLGLIVGQDTGVAPDAQWFACSNLARNLANPALYLDCMQFMLAPFPHGGDPMTDGNPALSADVINNSWGCPEKEGCDPEALLFAVRALRAAGIFVVASAGNEGPKCESIQYPLALYDEVFAVGAVDNNGNLASFSSRGPVTSDGSGRPKPDIVAPGVDVISAFPNNTYESLVGTSMAGPHVAGVVTLMWSANPSLIGDIEKTEEILRSSAKPFESYLPECVNDPAFPNSEVGHGIVDAYAAVTQALQYR